MTQKISGGTNLSFYPMPVLLVGTLVEGRPNYITVAWATRLSFTPAVMGISIGKEKYSHRGIEENQVFSINLPGANLMEKVDYCGIKSGRDTDKSTLFTTYFGKEKGAPLIQECPLSMVCKVVGTQDMPGGSSLFLGEVTESFLDSSCTHEGVPAPEVLNPLVFTMPDNRYWALGSPLGDAFSVGKRVRKS